MNMQSGSGRKRLNKPFQPAPGRDIQIETVPAIEARTKGFFVRAVVPAALSALAVTGGYGILHKEYAPLQGVWVVVGPIVGAMVNHYFGGHGRDL